ncbi:probable G-protein coupled receptor 179, partial [Serinus canaria]|uniref:probable G-protein coupled receptor 179 n=1 Tax=Serinus canaria TaxID=9135 RepID=UPI0021CC8B9C
SGRSQSSEKAEICPWESQGSKSNDKAEICPWEVAEPQLEKGTGPGKEKLPREASKAVEKRSTDRVSICPWESLDTEQPLAKPQTGSSALPKAAPGKSQSSEKAEICPWESQDVESSSKAEICPWEVAEEPSSKEKSRQDKEDPSRVSKSPSTSQRLLKEVGASSGKKDRESVCPWESLDKEQPPAKPHTGSSALPKAAPGKSQSSEICPWESQDLKSSDKAEICPWEVAEPQLEKGAAPGKEKLPPREASKALEKGSRERESICPWESLDTEQPPAKPHTGSSALPKAAPGKSQSPEKAEICPWESQDVESSSKAEICPWEVAEPPCQQPKAKQVPAGGPKGDKRITRQAALASPERSLDSRDRVSVCPWESLDTEQPLAKPHAGSSALPKAAPGKPQNPEKAEICPWESQDLKSSDKAEICPWEVAEPQVEKGTGPGKERLPRKETTKAVEKGSRERESICPWESLDTEQPPAKPHTGSSALPKAAPGKSQSSESLKAEICPWESQGSKSSDKAEICPWESQGSKSSDKAEICPWESQGSKSSGKAEICPWEVAEPQLEKGAAPGKKKLPSREASKAVEKGSRDRESICPWESLDTEELSLESAVGKEPSKKSDCTESRKSQICPWEAAELIGLEEEIPQPGVQPQGAQRGSPARTGQPGASAVSPTLLEKSRGRSQGEAEHKPLRRLLPSTPQPGVGSSSSPGAGRAEVCPWEAGEAPAAPAEPRLGPRKSSGVCPWEEESTEPSRSCPGQGRARDGGGL